MIRLILFYATSTGLQKGIVFLASLLLAHVFSLSDIGLYVLVQTIGQLIVPILTLNLTVALMREAKSNPYATRRLLFFSVRGILIFVGGVSFFLYFFIFPDWINLGVQLGVTEALFGLAMAVLQGRERVNVILKMSLMKTTGFAIVLGLAYLDHISVKEVIYLQLILGWIVDVLLLIIVFKLLDTEEREDGSVSIKEMVKYSVATLPHTAALWLSISSDRLILGLIKGKSAIGGYALAYTMAQIVALWLSGVITAVPPKIVEEPDIWRDPSYVVKFIERIALISFCVILFVLSIWKANEKIFHLIPATEPHGYILICIISVAFSFSMYYVLFASYMYLNRETGALKYMGFWIAPLNLLLMYGLVRILGTIGASIGLVLSYLIFGVSYGYIAVRLEPTLKLVASPLIKISLMLLFASLGMALLIENIF